MLHNVPFLFLIGAKSGEFSVTISANLACDRKTAEKAEIQSAWSVFADDSRFVRRTNPEFGSSRYQHLEASPLDAADSGSNGKIFKPCPTSRAIGGEL